MFTRKLVTLTVALCFLAVGPAQGSGLSIHHFLDPETGRVTSSEIHLELMDCYRRISSYSTNVGRAIMSWDRFGDPDYEEN